jgi:glycosyltransferase involved in cell wall biosynthesis
MIGLVDYEYLPEVLARANVGIIPFEDCDLVRSTSPIKMYEYLAAGLPVVTTPIPEAEALAAPGILRVATTAEGFASALEDSLSGGMVEERQEIAKAYSWDRVFGKALEQTMRAPSR